MLSNHLGAIRNGYHRQGFWLRSICLNHATFEYLSEGDYFVPLCVNRGHDVVKIVIFLFQHDYIRENRRRLLDFWNFIGFFFNKFMFVNTIFFLATYLNRIFKNQNFSTFTVVKIDFFLNLWKG